MKKHPIRGFSIVEILLALAIVSVAITGATVLAFGSQDAVRDAGLSQEALYKVEQALEEKFASLKLDWNQLAASAIVADSIYDKQVLVTDISECVKQVESRADWDVPQRSQVSSLITLFSSTSTIAALGGDCNTTPPSFWGAPDFYNNPEIIHPGSAANDVDALKNSKGMFIFIASMENGNHETFWVADVSDPDNPTTIGQYDNDDDVYALDGYLSGDTGYAFLAVASSTAQLQVMKVDFSSYPGVNPTVTHVASLQLPGVGNSYPQGRSIYYLNSRVYIGTHDTAGPEFHVFDVSNPESPTHLGSVELTTNVHDIVVRDTLAYLATSDNNSELCIIDVSDPSAMQDCEDVTGMEYDAAGNFDGTAIDVLGSNAYLGRADAGGSHDFLVLSVVDPLAVDLRGSLDLGINSNTEVTALKTVGSLVFVVTSDTNYANGGGPFLVYDVSDPTNITLVSTCAVNFSEKSTGIDYLDEVIFVSNESNDALRIMFPTPSCSP